MADKAGRPGVGVDETGGQVVDPTANVIALNEAAQLRQDDLRAASDRYNAAEIQHVKEVAGLRADYAERLASAEAKRIDAIRAVDVNAVAVASQRASDQATVLATQVAQSAEALRALVATTAAAASAATQQQTNTLSARITTLEQAQYEGKGKQSYVDPMMVEIVAEMKSLRSARSESTGQSQGVSMSAGVIVAAFGILFGLISVGVAAFSALR